jgi:hypothetical protein
MKRPVYRHFFIDQTFHSKVSELFCTMLGDSSVSKLKDANLFERQSQLRHLK